MENKEQIEELLRITKETLKLFKESKIKELPEVKASILELENRIIFIRACLLELEEKEKENE